MMTQFRAMASKAQSKIAGGPWPVFVAYDFVRQTYRELPGPAWVKISLVVICLAIPGPQDEMLLVALPKICKLARYTARKIAARKARPAYDLAA
jgi:hypothetical protein